MSQPKLYVIGWVHRTEHGNSGRGKKKMTELESVKLAQELNADYPHIFHFSESEDSERQTPSRD